ncbi:TetR/AcrR family transcriptional regulator [Phenylobacterium sp. LjRoot225]|uniref:TetR family transcriptional regulator C-terminal domain-containing protein n=1 Tax=Phenylobacterium sp. LjRoot225 TaxID=3342285 RepID=UPI003ED08903
MASRLIAAAGLEAVTIRDVAEAANCSTAIVSHYFRNKRELLILTYYSSIDMSQARCDRVLAADREDLRAFTAEFMPLDEERLIEWKIWLAFWARAVADPEIAEIQRGCVTRARDAFLGVMRTLDAKDLLIAGLDLREEAQRILMLLMGMAVQVMFDPVDWPAKRQQAMVDAELRKLYRPGRIPPGLMAAEAALERA